YDVILLVSAGLPPMLDGGVAGNHSIGVIQFAAPGISPLGCRGPRSWNHKGYASNAPDTAAATPRPRRNGSTSGRAVARCCTAYRTRKAKTVTPVMNSTSSAIIAWY